MGQVAWGIAKGFDAKETARMAAQKAMIKLGTGHPSLAICFISPEFDTAQAVSGISGMLGNIPLWGFSTEYPITLDGEHERSILIMIISGKDLEAEVHLLKKEGSQTQLSEIFSKTFQMKEVSKYLLVGDGVKGFPDWILDDLKNLRASVIGCLGSGEFYQGNTTQFAGHHSERGGIAAMALGKNYQLGVGLGHGWQDMGFVFQVGRYQDLEILEIDGVSPIQIYERVFGYPAKQWTIPPLSEIISLYPLGIELFPGSTDMFLRSPLGVGLDGSLKVNASLADGQMAHIMVGDIDFCLDAARQAVQTAKDQVKLCHPLAVIVLIDYAWHLLFKERIVEVFKIVQQEQPDVPIIGAYTLGHLYYQEQESISHILNQNVMVLIIAEN